MSQAIRHAKYLILGAGVSGLTFAGRLDGGEYLILEKEAEAGGYCRTTRRGDYVWDQAGHFFHFSHPELREAFRRVLAPEETVERVKNTRIYYNGLLVDYPFQKNIHQLPKEELIDCLYGLAEKEEKETYSSFLDMLYGKFGEGITERFLRPYNEKLYACSLDRLDADAMGRFFPYAELREIIRNMKVPDDSSYNRSFLYPRQGAAVFIRELLKDVDEGAVRYGETVVGVDTAGKTVTTDKGVYSFEYLVSSIPLDRFVEMSDAGEGVDRTVFSSNQVLVLNLGFDRPAKDRSIHWLYVPGREFDFYRAGFYSNILGTDKLSMYIEIGYPSGRTISREEIDAQLTKTLEGLRRMGVLDGHRLADWQAVVMDPAYVHISEKSREAVNALKKALAEKGVYLVGRYGAWKYCSIEDCMIDALDTARAVGARR